MQISDMLGQYNRNVTNGTEELRGAQGTQKLVSTVGDLGAGSIFEGTVNQVKNGKVTLALGNGQTITARLDGKVDIKPGTSMFFQVKSNDGITVAIRPYTGVGNTGNPILLGALTAAQIPVNERNLVMVDAMMQEQMSVGRQSLLDMVKVLSSNPGADVKTIVQMVKLGLPVTEEAAVQFEQYMSGRQAVLNDMNAVTQQMINTLGSDILTSEEAFSLYGKMLDIFTAGDAASGVNIFGAEQSGGFSGTATRENISGASDVAGTEQSGASDVAVEIRAANTEKILGMAAGSDASGNVQNLASQLSGRTLGQLFGEAQLANLTKSLQEIPSLLGNTELFVGNAPENIFVDTMQGDEVLAPAGMAEAEAQPVTNTVAVNRDMPVGEFLKALQRALGENGGYGFHGVKELFAGKEFKAMMRQLVEQQWLIKPQELLQDKKLSSLYERVERQLGQMEQIIHSAGIEQPAFSQAAAEVRGNIEFMNQLNQIYTYVQLPLKMSGQNANGELYVYTNKKQLSDPDAELTAFLHLDMDNLGATDVSVRMQNRQVRTNFYLADDASYRLVEKHLPILEKHLKNKGYTCNITITNDKKEENPMASFLKQGQPPTGSLHRYSFDVRA